MKAIPFLAAAAAVLLSACAGYGRGPFAEARLVPVQGHTTTGTAIFTQKGNDIEVIIHVAGLGPGANAVRIYDGADCSAPDDKGAGGRLGDMPMPQTDAYGNARLAAVLPGLTLSGAGGLVGKSVVVLAAPGGLADSHAGGSGVRMACGVVVQR